MHLHDTLHTVITPMQPRGGVQGRVEGKAPGAFSLSLCEERKTCAIVSVLNLWPHRHWII